MTKRIMAWVLGLGLLAGLCGCGRTEAAPEVTAPPTAYYTVDEAAQSADAAAGAESEDAAAEAYPAGKQAVELPEGARITGLSCFNGKIYASLSEATEVSGELYEMTGGSLCRLEPDGTLTRLAETGAFGTYFAVLPDESIWYYDTVMDDAVNVTFTHILCHMAADGAQLARVEMDTQSEAVMRLLPGADGGVVILMDQRFAAYDAAGAMTGEAKYEGAFLYSGAAALPDGRIAAAGWPDVERDERELLVLDPETMTLQSLGALDVGIWFNGVLGGTLDCLWVDNRQPYVYDLETQTMTSGVDWAALGLNSEYVGGVAFLDAATMVAYVRQSGDGLAGDVYVFPAGYTLRGADKTVLTLAGVNFQSELRQLAVNFNEASEDYYVELLDYSDNVDGRDPERLLYELNTGELPDLILCNGSFGDEVSIDTLARKGYLADIGALIDSDADMTRAGFLENVLDALSVDGVLCSVPLIYDLETAAASAATVGTDMGCTFDDVRAWLGENEGLGLVADVYAHDDRWLGYILKTNASAFIDRSGGTAALCPDAIEQTLEFARFVVEYGASGGDEMDGDYLLAYIWENEISSLSAYCARRIGLPATAIGWPCLDGVGAVIEPLRELAIASDTEHMDGCWAFIRYMLTDYQAYLHSEESRESSLPIRVDSLEADIEHAVSVYDASREEVEAFAALLRAADRVYRSSSPEAQVVAIVKEQAADYLAGDASLDKTVAAIESRASLYLAEQG